MSQYNRSPQQNQSEPTLDRIWPDYLKGGYFDEEGNLKTEYVSREKMEPLAEAMSKGKPPLTTNQLRRFFGHCRAIEMKIRARHANWDQLSAQFHLLDVAAADSMAKSPPKIPKLFHEFIKRNVAKVYNEKAFLYGFLPHFEALVGFGTQFFRDERR
jgi:CRISPR type III-A-associated protein Csm2